MNLFEFVQSQPRLVVLPTLIFLGVFLALLAIRTFLYRLLHRWAARTETALDDIFIGATKTPFLLWCVILGLHVAVGTSQLDPNLISYVRRLLGALIVFSISMVLAEIALHTFRFYASKTQLPATGIAEVIMKIVILSIGVSLALGVLGVDITALVAALGIGGLALALGLQDTLANLFAGIHILLAKPIRVGDYVELDSGQKGYVVDIGWRGTQIRVLPNNMVIIPNNRLIQSIITNYYMPQQELSVLVQVGVHYDSDMEEVERITRDVARETMKRIRGGIPEFEPFIRYHTFGDSSINLSVILRAREVVDQYLIKHEFVKALHARYKEEGIVIPYPIRTLDVPENVLAHLEAPEPSASVGETETKPPG